MLDKAANERKQGTDNVTRTSDWQALEAFFQELPAQISPESFRTNYLPLLNLQENILDAIRQGQLEYTKARAIARVKDSGKRQALLDAAIAENLSLAQIKERIANINAATSSLNDNKPSLKSRVDVAYSLVKKAKIWDDPKKQKRLLRLLAELEALASVD